MAEAMQEERDPWCFYPYIYVRSASPEEELELGALGSLSMYFCGTRQLARRMRRSVISASARFAGQGHPIICNAEEVQ
eukprot:jgi/Tetstr1/438866/TSEL_027375.t1